MFKCMNFKKTTTYKQHNIHDEQNNNNKEIT